MCVSSVVSHPEVARVSHRQVNYTGVELLLCFSGRVQSAVKRCLLNSQEDFSPQKVLGNQMRLDYIHYKGTMLYHEIRVSADACLERTWKD